MRDGWMILGWVIVIGLPSVVVLAVTVWPERLPKERSVETIRQRTEDEDGLPARHAAQ
ncbi:hypothetical protein AB0B25_10005 [Nocardia sp. NPDC049190]|uniref:hypothetical protein n=1 Tax=Nocardia sp. NPDC049190 TaxID=3155650 RepID=UPI0033E54200